MALLNASGAPVAMATHAIQIDVAMPTEAIASMGSPNWGGVFAAIFQLIAAYTSGNPAAMAAAIQALFKALFGG